MRSVELIGELEACTVDRLLFFGADKSHRHEQCTCLASPACVRLEPQFVLHQVLWERRCSPWALQLEMYLQRGQDSPTVHKTANKDGADTGHGPGGETVFSYSRPAGAAALILCSTPCMHPACTPRLVFRLRKFRTFPPCSTLRLSQLALRLRPYHLAEHPRQLRSKKMGMRHGHKMAHTRKRLDPARLVTDFLDSSPRRSVTAVPLADSCAPTMLHSQNDAFLSQDEEVPLSRSLQQLR